MKTALTIAGSDSSGGAGIQADIKTMMANGVYAMSAINALTAQNTTGVADIMNVTPAFLAKELDCVFTDIYPDAVKIGMVSEKALIRTIAETLRKYHARNVVVDPVMVATSGAKLIDDDAVETLKAELFPLADVLTPNIPETELLTGQKIVTEEDRIAAARELSERYSCAVLCKGGHSFHDAETFCTGMEKHTGSMESGLPIRTRTGPAAPYPLPLRPISQRAILWMRQSAGQRSTSAERSPTCWIWEPEAAR